jgi:hypothetical protein
VGFFSTGEQKWKRKEKNLGMKSKIAAVNARKMGLKANGNGTMTNNVMFVLLAETFNKKGLTKNQ